jgi:phosphatidylethanolamine-binding protein (PEBP) family uncharacterized protein
MTKRAVWIAALAIGAWSAGGANAQVMTLTSPDLKESGTIANEQAYKGYGCTGGNVSPITNWT